jgi:kynurenine formamidase
MDVLCIHVELYTCPSTFNLFTLPPGFLTLSVLSHSQTPFNLTTCPALNQSPTTAARSASLTPDSTSIPFPLPSDFSKHHYAGANTLQSYTVHIPCPDTSELTDNSPKYFLIFIHGGYYRDPLVDASSFNNSLSLLLNSPLCAFARAHISGYASINYRLSPHSDYPQDPNLTSNYELRNASHPDHIEDVVTAIADLQHRYGFGSRYILMGHSVGATLGLQAVICGQVPWTPPAAESYITFEPDLRISPPTAFIGLNGIYSFPLIHSTNPDYEPMTSNALGPDPEVHKAASPALYPPSAFAPPCSTRTAQGLRHIVLAASHDDKLVPWDQVECMRDVFADDGETDVEVRVVEMKGDHNDCWRKAEDVAWVVSLTVKVVMGIGM